VLKNSVTAAAGGKLWGYHPDELPREAIADEEGRPLWRYGTDSPLRTTTGDLEAMALYAGDGAARITAIRPAAEIVHHMMGEAIAAIRAGAASICPVGRG
jgi:nitronate monooxygenase